MGKRAQTSIEYIILGAAAIIFVVVVALATRELLTKGGSETEVKAAGISTIVATIAQKATPIVIPQTQACNPNTPCGVNSFVNTTCPTGMQGSCTSTCNKICSADGTICMNCMPAGCTPECNAVPSPSTIVTASATASASATATPTSTPSPTVTVLPSPTVFACATTPAINASNTTDPTPNSPIVFYADFLNCTDMGKIFGGRRLNKVKTYNNLGQFRYGNFTAPASGADFWLGGTDSTNTAMVILGNGTIKTSGDLIDGVVYSVHQVVDINDDGIDEIVTGGNDGTAGYGMVLYADGTEAWRTLGTGGDHVITMVEDFNGDGRKEIGYYQDYTGSNGIGNFTVYNASPTRQVVWTLNGEQINTSTTCKYVLEAHFEPNMYGSGSGELAFAYSPYTGSCNAGIAVYNSTDGTFLYRANSSFSTTRIATAGAIDANKKGYKDMWLEIDGSRNLWMANKSSDAVYSKTLLEASNAGNEIAVGDLNGDGYENEFVTVLKTIRAYKVSNTVPTLYWSFSHPYLQENRSGQGSMPYNALYVEDINDDGLNEVVFFSGTGWVYILNNNGTLLNAFENEEGYFAGTGSVSSVPNGQKAHGDISRNATTGTTLIGFATQKVYGTDGYGYSFEYEPCYVSVAGTPAKVMKWDPLIARWKYENASGLPAGLYGYTVYCDGNFSGYGAASVTQFLNISA
ncbi:MAG: hypothetical protein V1835_04570 [Candidatus Micrarchaeota archaeon]